MVVAAEQAMSGQARPEPRAGRSWPAWHAALSAYLDPSPARSLWQLLNTLVPYGCCWFLAVRAFQRGDSVVLTLVPAAVAAALLVRLFILFHDCVHGSFFRSRRANNVLGHLLGVLVFTPFEDWRFSHLRHHATYANLDARGFGDIWTLTRREYDAASWPLRLSYRLYRHPVVLLGLGALFTFLLRNRLPSRATTRKERMSVLLTNLLIVGVALLAASCIGWRTYLLFQLPLIGFAGAAGIWLFYVQHQFAGVYWARKGEWDALRAAMEGSSCYRLPAVLRWVSGNIGFHHVHHLKPRIPNYRLKPCYDAIPELRLRPPLTLRGSLAAVRLKVWDEERRELAGFPR